MARPPQVNLHSKDVGKTFEYLTGVLGFSPDFRVAGPEGKIMFAGAWQGKPGQSYHFILGDIHEALHGHYDHGEFGAHLETGPLGTGVVLYCFVPNVDKYYQRIVAKGAIIDEPPTNQFWGDRTISVLTPDGYYFTFATPIKGFRFPPEFEARLERFTPARKGRTATAAASKPRPKSRVKASR